MLLAPCQEIVAGGFVLSVCDSPHTHALPSEAV